MKFTRFSGLFIFGLLLSCKDDDEVSCLTCHSYLTTEFVLCNEANGNASVNGEDTGVSYAVYLQGLNDEGVECH